MLRGLWTEPDLADKAKDTLKALLIEMVGPKLDIPEESELLTETAMNNAVNAIKFHAYNDYRSKMLEAIDKEFGNTHEGRTWEGA